MSAARRRVNAVASLPILLLFLLPYYRVMVTTGVRMVVASLPAWSLPLSFSPLLSLPFLVNSLKALMKGNISMRGVTSAALNASGSPFDVSPRSFLSFLSPPLLPYPDSAEVRR